MMTDKKVAYSQSRKNTVIFDQVTRAIYTLDDNVDIGFLEYEMVSRSRVRRPSSKISERIFFKYVIDRQNTAVLEVGGNDGRHVTLGASWLRPQQIFIHLNLMSMPSNTSTILLMRIGCT